MPPPGAAHANRPARVYGDRGQPAAARERAVVRDAFVGRRRRRGGARRPAALEHTDRVDRAVDRHPEAPDAGTAVNFKF